MPPINLKGRISVKINLIAIKIAHAHLYYVAKSTQSFKKIHQILWEKFIIQTLYPIMQNRNDYV